MALSSKGKENDSHHKTQLNCVLSPCFGSTPAPEKYFGQETVMEKHLFQQLVVAPVDGVIVTVRIDCTHTSE